MVRSALSSLVLFAIICVFGCCKISEAQEIRFSTQIRPILSDKCFQCHGPDSAKRAAELRFDDEASAKAGLSDGTRVIVPGDASGSSMITRITSTDPELRMPPAESGKELTEKEVALLKRWIEAGAQWGKHWSLEPVQRPEAPTPEVIRQDKSENVTNDIDRFVLARIHDAGLIPNVEADKHELLRRVTFDLTGLPPAPEEMDAFLADTSSLAYQTVVDRLLLSPRYGEHMARYWLDAARYGDTHGLHLDNYREMWAYRDWVVNAFNTNMPFSQFVIEQLAGDLLPNPTDDQLIATGFNRCHVTTGEGGSIDEEVEVRNTNDRVVTMGAVFLGLTLDCCRCHDHKFDPITQADYYSLYSYFNSIDGQPLDGNTKDHAPILKVLTAEQKQQMEDLKQSETHLRDQLNQIVTTAAYVEPEAPSESAAPEPTEFVWVEDGPPPGTNSSGTTPWKFARSPMPVHNGEASQVRTAKGLSQHYFEEAKPAAKIGDGDLFFAWVYLAPSDPPQEIMLQWHDGASWNHRAFWGSNSIDWGENNTPSRLRKGDLPALGQWVRLEVSAEEVGLTPGSKVNGWAFTQFDGTVYWDHSGMISRSSLQPVYDSLAVWLRDQKASGGSELPPEVKAALQQPAQDASAAQLLKNYFLEHAYSGTRKATGPLHQQLASLDQQMQAMRENAATTLIYRERGQLKPAFVLNRGEYDQPRDAVQRRVPSVMPPLPADAPNNRLGLAEWLTASSHPLTSRVIVNRFWQQFFGTGLVKTAEDFGSQGEQPSHPELLDWLSSELMQPRGDGAAHAWDVKNLIRTIVLSATYRRGARVSPELQPADASNRLLARGPRFRLDAESLRDQALFVSGLLSERMGGPSVKPAQPDGLWQAVGYSGSNTVRFVKDDGPEKVHRRTLYTFIKRTAPPPQMAIMDAPSRESCVLRRERTNSPMQALMLMNDPQYVECARALAERALAEAGQTPESIVDWMYQRCLLRLPSESEQTDLLSDFMAYRDEYTAHPEDARRLISIGEVPASADIPAEQLAAWTMIANTLLNLDAVISR